jgi:molecular chaperone GrpE
LSEEQRREQEPVEQNADESPEGEAAGEDRGMIDEQHVRDLDELGEEPEAAEEPDTPEQDLSALAEELELVRRERDEYLDAVRRLKAEFENSRKRQEREKERILHAASESLVTELLPVLDNLDRALESEGDIREGVRATRDQLVDVLGREGLLPVASDGQSFDPNVHEAVMSQPSEEHEEGTIIQTFQRGYVLNGKPIRPAKVVVAQ